MKDGSLVVWWENAMVDHSVGVLVLTKVGWSEKKLACWKVA